MDLQERDEDVRAHLPFSSRVVSSGKYVLLCMRFYVLANSGSTLKLPAPLNLRQCFDVLSH